MSSSKYHEDIIMEDEESNPIFDSISPERCSHIEDITEQPSSIENAIYYYVPLLIPPLRYTNYLKRVFEYLSYTLLFDITMPIVQPLNFFILYGLFPAGALVLILLDFAIRVLSFFGIDSSQASVSEWRDITETDIDGIVRRGTVALGKPFESLDENKEEQDLVKQIRDFNIDMVETLLFLSSTVYERKEKNVNNAIDQIRKILYSGANPSTQDVRYLKHQLEESEAAIKAQAEKWELEFTSITELNSYGGPYAGMFWNVEKNFIVVAFKGTTPTYFSEWLIDFLVQKIDARSYLYGNVHEGFYTTLFPTNDREASKVYRRSPTLRLIEAIRVKAAEMARYNRARKRTDPVSVWVTGHSLGGGLATLFYTRLLKASEVLGENCILRDGFVFASPVVGDDGFAAYFSSQSNKPFEPNKTLWRVVAGNDIVPHIVIGNHNHKVSRYINKIEALNYVHVGEEIQFHFNGSIPSSTRPIFRDNDYFFIGNTLVWSDLKQTLPKKSDEIDQPARRKRPPVKVNSDKTFYSYERFYPSPFRNHLTHRYFIALEKGRNYFEALDESNDVN